VLPESEARAAVDIASEIAAALVTRDSLRSCKPWALAERALLFFYLNQARPSAQYRDLPERLMTQALKQAATVKMSPWMYAGSLLVGWTHAHLTSGVDATAFYEAIDEPFIELLSDETWRPPFDLLGGLGGLGVYWLERYPDPHALKGLEALVRHFETRADLADSQVKWSTPWVFQFDPVPLPDPNDCYAIGMAHGVSTVIALLSRIHIAGVMQERIAPLLTGTIVWLLRHRSKDTFSQFPAVAGTHIDRKSYFGWCWGDIGVVPALTLAARALNKCEWEAVAIEVGEHAARQTHAVDDACLCHGGIGNAHMFSRLSRLWHLPALEEAARNWYRIGVGLREAGEGTAGFYKTDYSGERPVRYNDTQFLSGAVGIALGLLAGGSHSCPAWDRLMLVSDASIDCGG